MPSDDGQSEGKCTILCPAHAVRLFTRQASSTQGNHAQAVQADLLPGTRCAAGAQDASVSLMTDCHISRLYAMTSLLCKFCLRQDTRSRVACRCVYPSVVAYRIEVALRGLTSSAKLISTFTCSEASTIIKAITAGTQLRALTAASPLAHDMHMRFCRAGMPSEKAVPMSWCKVQRLMHTSMLMTYSQQHAGNWSL